MGSVFYWTFLLVGKGVTRAVHGGQFLEYSFLFFSKFIWEAVFIGTFLLVAKGIAREVYPKL